MLAEGFLHAPLLPHDRRFPWPVAGDTAWAHLSPENHAALKEGGAAALASPYPMLTATQFLAFVRSGSREIYETPYFARRKILIRAALAYCADPAPALLDQVIDGIWCICEETFWGISAHNGSAHPGQVPARERPLPDKENPYIDLFAAQTGCTLALILRLLEKELDSVTPLLRRRVLAELDQRLFKPFLHRDDFWWMGMIRSDLCNWTPWIVSSVFLAAQAVLWEDSLLHQIFSRGLAMLDRYLACVPEDGGCDEGVAYWNMAGGALLDCLEAVEQVTGGQVTYWEEEKLRAIGAFPLHSHIHSPWFWNFADCDAQPRLDGERIFAYGKHIGSEALASLGASMPLGVDFQDTPQMNRVLCTLFRAPAPAAAPPSEDKVSLPCLQVFARQKGSLYAAIKGGHNGESHNHNDVGSFVLYVDGAPCILDAGNMTYTAITFSDARYTLWNTQSANHNVPMIGAFQQAPGKAYAAREVVETADAVSMELAAAYPPEAGVESLRRVFSFGEVMTLTDQISLAQPLPVTWVFMSRYAPAFLPEGMHLGKLKLYHDPMLQRQVEEIPVTDPRMATSFPGSLWRVTLTAAPAQHLTQTFTLTKEE